MIGPLNIVTLFLFAVPAMIFATYGVILFYYGRPRKVETDYDESFEPYVSIIVPTHNEEMIISRKIQNLHELKYPQEKLEIIFVDDSTDETWKKIESSAKSSPNIRLIRFSERMGYSPSMRAGVQAANHEIIVYAEAGSFIDEQAIRKLVRHFKSPKIGLVTGRGEVLNTSEDVGNAESTYMKISNFLRTAESKMDSTFFVKGEATAVRRELVLDLTKCGATFDNTSALFVRQKGFKAIYDPEVKFYEYAPRTYKDWNKQKTIRAANWIKMLLSFRSMFFQRKYGKFGMITLPSWISMLVVVPVFIPAGMISLVALTFLDPVFSLYIWGIFGLGVLLSFIVSRRMLVTAVQFEYALLKALYQIGFTRVEHDKIDKAVSTRTGVTEI